MSIATVLVTTTGAQVPVQRIQIGRPAAQGIQVIAASAVQPLSAVAAIPVHALIRLEHVQDELELSDDQKQKLEEASRQNLEQSRTSWEGFRDLAPQQRLDKMAEIRREDSRRLEVLSRQIAEILLPRQRRQLEEIAFRMRAQSALANPKLLEQLELDAAQEQRLQQLRKELDERIRQLQREMVEQSLQVLTPEQRRQLEEQLAR